MKNVNYQTYDVKFKLGRQKSLCYEKIKINRIDTMTINNLFKMLFLSSMFEHILAVAKAFTSLKPHNTLKKIQLCYNSLTTTRTFVY